MASVIFHASVKFSNLFPLFLALGPIEVAVSIIEPWMVINKKHISYTKVYALANLFDFSFHNVSHQIFVFCNR